MKEDLSLMTEAQHKEYSRLRKKYSLFTIHSLKIISEGALKLLMENEDCYVEYVITKGGASHRL